MYNIFIEVVCYTKNMKLIIGQGNPGKEYEKTRHNIGFMMLDFLAQSFGASWQEKSKFKAHIAEMQIGGQKAILAKPNTFYNLTGEAAIAIANFYKISPEDILVIHDELALPFGTIRTRIGGSDAGNNGIKNLISHLGSDFARIRIGVANETLNSNIATDFVLNKLNSAETKSLEDIAQHTALFVSHFVHKEQEFAHTSIKLDQPQIQQ